MRTIDFETKRMRYALFVPLVLVILLWLILILEWGMDMDFHALGVYPRRSEGLLGIITSPLVHANAKHLFSNTISLLALSWGLFYFYTDLGYKIFPLLWLLSGFITWSIGRESWHIGASGLIYSLAFFLCISGIIRKYIPLMAISLIVVFLYGSMVWSIFPFEGLIQENISWESHLSGAISGITCALIFRKYGPQKPEEENENEEEEEEEENENNEENENKHITPI